MSIGPIRPFTVAPSIPPGLRPLTELAYNLRWSWHRDTAALFERIESDLWAATRHNPIQLLALASQDTLDRAARDTGVLSHLDRVRESLARYLARPPYRVPEQAKGLRVAYFSAEVAVADCLPTYAGGLGVLAGDHLKSASDLGIPLAGVSLLYHEGFAVQKLATDGWQQESYPSLDPFRLPIQLCLQPSGEPVRVSVQMPEGPVSIQVWKAQVGRVPLYLLDTNSTVNPEPLRMITSRLYGGDRELRIRQEIVLGIGGIRALEALDERVTTFHMNEGHSAFLGLERIRLLMEREHLSFEEAREVVASASVFTTHTPLPAGNDEFEPRLVERYLPPADSGLGLSLDRFIGLGRAADAAPDAPFSMTVLALRLSGFRNGVSRLHGQVSRRAWASVWPGVPEPEIPIGSVTNGVHYPTWIHEDVAQIYDRYLGRRWRDSPEEPSAWENVQRIPDEEMWRSRERRREELVNFARSSLREAVLDPRALTIGFARRFAPYKRADLILRDLDRLERLVSNPRAPLQIIYAGKAHPRNDEGKEVLRRVYQVCQQQRFRGKIVFLEDYEMELGRRMVQGVDVWLNTPRRPLEASGTSGMKATLNGVLQLSTDDGWWAEADREGRGWTIGGTTELEPWSVDAAEAGILYDLLEREVVPSFYERGADNVPRRWMRMVKDAVATMCPVFNTHRMLREYSERSYIPAVSAFRRLGNEDFARARALVAWKKGLVERFSDIRVESVGEERATDGLTVGSFLKVRAEIVFGRVSQDEVSEQIYTGRLDSGGVLADGFTHQMHPAENVHHNGMITFEGQIPLTTSGQHGYAVRILPKHADLLDAFDAGKVIWA